MPVKFYWEEEVKNLPIEIREILLNILWINDLDDHQRARLRYILQKSLDDKTENVMGLIPIEELDRREKAETEYSE